MKQLYSFSLFSANSLLFLLLACTYTTTFGQANTAQSLPADFPKYIDTGNAKKDAQTYTAQKQAWIATHTEEYIAMQPGLSEEGKVALRAQNPIRRENPIQQEAKKEREKPIQREVNKEREEEISEEYREKLLWILEHEEEYRQNVDAKEANETIISAKKVFNR